MSLPSQTFEQSKPIHVALSEYKKRTGIDLLDHRLAKELQSCGSVEAVLDIIQGQADAFDKFRNGGSKLMKWIHSSVHVLYTLSATLGHGVGVAVPSSNAVFTGIGVLLAATKDVRASHDALVDLFERIQFFLKRLGNHTQFSPTNDMVEILVKIMAEAITILSIATKEMQQSPTIYLRRLLGRTDIEDSLKRLDSLTQEEGRMVITQVLKSINELKDETKKANEAAQQMANMGQIGWDQIEWDVRKWFSSPDPSINYNMAYAAHHEGTTTWFFDSNLFKEWELDGSLLWIHGKPGSGKSILCSVIINHAISLRDAGQASVAYFYFDFRDDEKRDFRNFVTSLLTQLADSSGSDTISHLYSTHGKGAKQPSIRSLTNCLHEMLFVAAQRPIYIIVDALDECPDMFGMPTPREAVLNLLEDLVGTRIPNLRICVTSRPEVDIKAVLEPLANCVISLHDEDGQQKDISYYVSNVVYSDRNMRKWRDKEKELVVKELSKRADGMFKWVFCQLEVLRHCLPVSIRGVLNELPESLNETYRRILKDIPKASQGHAHRMLQSLVVAVRPLRVEELAEVLAFDFDTSPGVVPRYRPELRSNDQEQAVLSTCSSLVTIVDDHDSRVVQFSHFSVKEFLMSPRLASSFSDVSLYHILPSVAHTILAQTCLGLLLYLDDHMDDESVKDLPLAKYAAEHWVTHAQFEDVALRVMDGMMSLFDPDNPHFAAWVGIYDIDEPDQTYRHPFSKRPTPLYYSSLCGFSDLARHLVTKCPRHSNTMGGRYEFPLLAALVRKHVRVAEILLEHGASVNIRGTRGRTPLHKIIGDSDTYLVQFLLKHGADVNARQDDLTTPLHLAMRNGNSTGAPLHWSALGRKLEIAKILLDHGANANAENDQGETPLHLVSRGDYDSQALSVDITKLLLERGADAHARDKDYATPWLLARYHGKLDIARVLLHHAKAPTEND
ncbi:hypothetical protein EDB85DRAFT_2162017 [Lactarius pseudohatsudake]|nr:hypothetical protein EDB85DRAFT_2162017 [Lactarius pseudohatsudake]